MLKLYFVLFLCFFYSNVLYAQSQASMETMANPSFLKEAKDAIAKANAQWAAGWKERNAEKVAAVFAEDGVQLSQNGSLIKGRKQIAERQQKAMLGVDPGVDVTVTTTTVWVNGDTAYETGTYKYLYIENGKPGKDEGKYMTEWKRLPSGDWKLVMDIGFPN